MPHSLHSALIRSQTARENKSTRHISWPALNNLECKNETVTMSSWVGVFFFSLYSMFLHTNWFHWNGLKPFNMIQVLCWKMRSLLSKEEKEIQHKNWKIITSSWNSHLHNHFIFSWNLSIHRHVLFLLRITSIIKNISTHKIHFFHCA